MLLLASEPHQVPGNEKSQTSHEKLNHQGIILSHLPSSIIETLVQNTLMSIPPTLLHKSLQQGIQHENNET
jgi:hypothetical protein